MTMRDNNMKINKKQAIVNEADDPAGIDTDELLKKNNDKVEKLDSKTKTIVKGILKILGKTLKNFAVDKSGDLIDELLLGQFKDSVIDIYKKEKLEKMSDDEASEAYSELMKDTKFKQGEEYSKLDSRKDDNTSSEIDPSSEKFTAMWYDKKKDQNVGKVLSDLVADIQQAAKKIQDDQKALAAKLKSMKVEVSDEDFANFGPMLQKAVNDGESAESISKTLKQLKSEIKESFDAKIEAAKGRALLTESEFILTEDMKNQFMIESLCNHPYYQEALVDYMINEGWFGDAVKKIGKGVKSGAQATMNLIPDKVKSSVKDWSKKAIETVISKPVGAMLQMGSLFISGLTGGWGPAIILRVMYSIEKHGKVLRNAFERQFTRFANSKGVITSMTFKIKDQPDSEYAMRFYAKDMVWRVLNLKDQLKHPSLKYSKEIINGDEGAAYRKRLAEIWDPMFDAAKGGKIDFVELFKQAAKVDIPEKALQAFKDFADKYETLKANCIESPKIDTRTQAVKKDKLDK